MSPTLVLASGSPRRLELLRRLGISPIRFPTDVDETPIVGETSAALVERLARLKAEAGWQARHQLDLDLDHALLVLAADTVVDVGGRTLGKPESRAEAKEMLELLSGTDHRVFTGVAVRSADDTLSTVTQTTVRFRALEPTDIEWYISTGEPMDKAGAYGIQGKGALLVEGVIGSYDNVVGLPVVSVDRLLRQIGCSLAELSTAKQSDETSSMGLTDISDIPRSLRAGLAS